MTCGFCQHPLPPFGPAPGLDGVAAITFSRICGVCKAVYEVRVAVVKPTSATPAQLEQFTNRPSP
jgi:hypothetical protein